MWPSGQTKRANRPKQHMSNFDRFIALAGQGFEVGPDDKPYISESEDEVSRVDLFPPPVVQTLEMRPSRHGRQLTIHHYAYNDRLSRLSSL